MQGILLPRVKPFAVIAGMNGTTLSPFLNPAIYPLELEIDLQLRAITFHSQQ